MTHEIVTKRSRSILIVALGAILFTFVGCDNDDGDPGPQGEPGVSQPPLTDTNVNRHEDSPGVALEITEISGASGNEGRFRIGDTVSIVFSLWKDDGSPWQASEMHNLRALISGPTFNYQRVIEEQRDVGDSLVDLGDGLFEYTFPVPLPDVYLPPYNDTGAFDEGDGELTDQELLEGTYTVGIYAEWEFDVEGQGHEDVGSDTLDFVIGESAVLQAREVVTAEHCNQCHESMRVHGGFRRDLTICLMCHTAGSEDRNTPDVEGGTPGATVSFGPMIHKIHNGAHLPSVLGVTTDDEGKRDYTAEKVPYRLVGFRDSVHDYSHVSFPVWPNLSHAMPRDAGYSDLDFPDRSTEDTIRRGATDCAKCHGDPDGDGPIETPAQGDLAYTQPTRAACGSCHDDWVFEHPYTANTQTMPAQNDDAACVLCHERSGDGLAVIDAHLHPLTDPLFNPGVNVTLSNLVPSGGSPRFEVGDPLSIQLDFNDDAGQPIEGSTLRVIPFAMTGPSTNPNLLISSSIPPSALSGPPPYTLNLPAPVTLEFVGDSTSSTGESFVTSRAPHWNSRGGTTSVRVRTATSGGITDITDEGSEWSNFVDVTTTTDFARDDYVVIDDGLAGEEYLQIALVDESASRIWFKSPLRQTHNAGAFVLEVTLSDATQDTDYSVDDPTATITEISEFGDGNAVVVTYTTDWIVPAVYPPPLNDAPGLDETWGEWKGKSLVDGTYSLGVWADRDVTVDLWSETQTYHGTSHASMQHFLIGTTTELEQPGFITSASTCYSCHTDLWFHGGNRRGYDSCLLCHGHAGAEDRPRWVAGNAPETAGVTVDFRTMLHKIHMGSALANAEDYTIVGFGFRDWPENYTPHTYEHVTFPTMPSAAQHCTACHGSENTAWLAPSLRNHPSEQGLPVRGWRSVCSSCHDSVAAGAHMDLQTSPAGVESCEICHDDSGVSPVSIVHKIR